MNLLTLKHKPSNQQQQYVITSCNYTLTNIDGTTEIRVNINMSSNVDMFLLQLFNLKLENIAETDIEASLVLQSYNYANPRTIVLKNAHFSGYFSESLSSYPGSEQASSNFELQAGEYSIDGIQFSSHN